MSAEPGTEVPGLGARVREFLAYRLPPGVGWAHVSGGLLVTLFAVQLATGILLALYYSPSATDAWDSVRYIEDEVRAGSLIRGLHHFAASAFVPLALLHAGHAFVCGAYKGRRRWTWLVGSLLFACLLGFGFTGYLLPWDLKAFFGTRVGVAIAGSVPLVGTQLRELMAGGPEVGPLTLPRFFAVHAVVLPLAFTGLLVLHLVLVRLHGITPDEGKRDRGETFHPHQLFRDAAAAFLLVLVLAGLAWRLGAPLEERADPGNTDYVPRPEWYFLGLQQLLRLFQGRFEVLGSFVLPTLGALLFAGLPWLDRNPERAARRRPLAMAAGALAALAAVGLTAWGAVEIGREERAMEVRLAERAEAPAEPAEPAEEAQPEDRFALARRGQRLYRELVCGACHDEGGAGELYGSPLLDLHGSRSPWDWTRDYLLEPVRLRYAEEGLLPTIRMPHYGLEPDEAAALALHLDGWTDEERVPPLDPERLTPLAPDEEREAAAIYADYDCGSCHVWRGEGEPVGPDLDGLAERRRAAYVRAIVIDPEGVVPGTSMTDFLMPEEEALLLTRYLLAPR